MAEWIEMQSLQLTDTATEATSTSSSSTHEETSSEEKGHSSRRRPESGDADAGSRSHILEVTDRLPVDVALTEIFSKLEAESKARMARVCRKWRNLVDDPALWQDTTVHLDVDALSPEGLDSLERRRIRSVVVTRCSSQKNLKRVISALPALSKLQADCIKLTNEGLADIFPKTLLSLESLGLWLDTLDGNALRSIAQVCPNISHLHVRTKCNEDLVHHVGLLRNLQELQLDNAGSFLYDNNLPGLPEKLEQMPHLTSLALAGLELGDEMLKHVCFVCPRLRILNVMLCTDNMYPVAQLADLEVLHLASRDPGAALSTDLIAKLRKVHTLSIARTWVGDTQLEALAKMPELEKLAISCINISKNGWRALGHGFRNLKCILLYQFDCSKCGWVEEFASLDSLETIVFKALAATELEMKSLCSALNRVRKVTIMHSPNIRSNHIKYIQSMENLKDLRLVSTEIGDEGLNHLAKCKAPLETLALLDCDVHDNSLLHVVESKKSLRNLEFNMEIDDSMLYRIVEELPLLQLLKTRVSQEAKRRLRRLRPGLVVQRPDDVP